MTVSENKDVSFYISQTTHVSDATGIIFPIDWSIAMCEQGTVR